MTAASARSFDRCSSALRASISLVTVVEPRIRICGSPGAMMPSFARDCQLATYLRVRVLAVLDEPQHHGIVASYRGLLPGDPVVEKFVEAFHVPE
jgi:hypothetical protein